MVLKRLTKEEYLSTFDPPMRFIEENDVSYGPFPIGEYVTECINSLNLQTNKEDIEIHYVYMNDKKSFCHILFSWGVQNTYLVLVTMSEKKEVHGHYLLGLNEEYGLYE
jgi:hypothetical protein